ncbi:hypothetical protein Pla108_22350 [Botrimarina colliarenosi]|uniref:Prepilin-type N-terminal cleavage/methylation domain-containing protein n=1 Tax=Botrimarina colliarenosi TaxID=2528001 RepID=A0A5C6AFJ3_9BACT|nr:hypothetical protein [Botrimarina colliarenosi]TWT98078.1 hypothetical protein Pla108_22350 [Botrimarina colliarenosi]
MTLLNAQRSGATLIEVAISTVLVGVLMVAALNTVGSAARTHLAASTSAEAWALAELLAAEVLAMPYEDPNGAAVFGTEPGETGVTRATLDDVDDYHNWTESPPKARDGTPLAGYTGWTTKVIVTLAETSASDGVIDDVGADEGLKRVRFQVTNPAGKVITVDTVRTRNGAGSTLPESDLPQVSRLSIDSAVGDGDQQRHGEQLLNGALSP